MRNNLPAFVKQPRLVDGAIAGIAAGAAAFAATGMLSFQIPHGATDALPAAIHLKHWVLIALSESGFHNQAAETYQFWLSDLAKHGVAWQIKTRMYASAIAGIAAAAWVIWQVGKPRDFRIKKEGGELIEDRPAVMKYGKKPKQNPSLEIFQDFYIAYEKLGQHSFVYGGTGAGKSTVAMPIIISADKRGDRKIIFDFKGLTEKWPGKVFKDKGRKAKDSDTVILAAHEDRTVQWHIAKDINTTQAAVDYAYRLIPESKEPVFSQGARQVFTGLIVKLIKEKPRAWSFKDLKELLLLDQYEMIELMREHYPQAMRAVTAAPVTVSGILLNLAAFTSLTHDLAEVWPTAGGFSITEWINNPDHKIRTVILKTSTQFETLSSAINGSLLGVICSLITSMPDVKPGTNPIWIWVDEFPTLGKIRGWETMLSTGRTKGFCTIMGLQSRSQNIEIYGPNITKSWNDSVGIKFIGRNDGEGAKESSEMIGSTTYSYPTYSTDSNGRSSVNWSAGQEEPLFSQTRIQNDLGHGKFIIHGIKGVELFVQFPNIFGNMPLLRAADIPSALCSTPHNIVSQSPTMAVAEDKQSDDSNNDRSNLKVTIAEQKTQLIETETSTEQLSEVPATSIENLDLAELTGRKLREEATDLAKEAVDKVSENVVGQVVESVLGADAAHVFETAMTIIETTEEISENSIQQTDGQVTNVHDRIATLKARKKLKLEQAHEQSL